MNAKVDDSGRASVLRDAARLKDVALTIARHGFGDVLLRLPLAKKLLDGEALPKGEGADTSAGARFAALLGELGPTYIKLGQVLSMRRELVPNEWTTALAKLQDDAPKLDFATVKRTVEEALGAELETLYARFEPEPLATASIAQTHRARTHDGVEVVVKVQRPGIDAVMRSDLSLLGHAARLLEASIDEMQVIGLIDIIAEFERGLLVELSFDRELAHLETFGKLVQEGGRVVVPKPVHALSTRTVLTMTYFEGTALRMLAPRSERARDAVETLVGFFAEHVLVSGFFHADPHPGNVLVGEDGTVCLIDLGTVGQLTQEQRDDLGLLIVAAIANDMSTTARLLLKVGRPRTRVNLTELKAEIERVRGDLVQARSLGDVDTNALIDEILQAIAKYRLRLGRDLSLAIKAGATLEGTIRALHPDIDIVGIVSPHVESVVSRRLAPERVLREMMGDAVGVGSLLRTVPEKLDQLLHDFDTGNVLVRPITPELDAIPKRIHSLAGTLAIAAFAQALTVACALTFPSDTSETGKIIACAITGALALFAWLALFVRHLAAGASPLRMTPLVKLFRK